MAKTSRADRRRYWQEAIERQKDSGQSIVAFCAKEELSSASFHAWKRRFRRLEYRDGDLGVVGGGNCLFWRDEVADNRGFSRQAP